MMMQLKVSKRRSFVNIILFVLFSVFAIVQLNDPDPFFWVLIYGLTACIPLISNYKNIPKIILWVILIGLLVYAFQYFPHLIDWLQTENKNELFGEMVYEKPYLEGTREFLGLLMSALVVIYILRQ